MNKIQITHILNRFDDQAQTLYDEHQKTLPHPRCAGKSSKISSQIKIPAFTAEISFYPSFGGYGREAAVIESEFTGDQFYSQMRAKAIEIFEKTPEGKAMREQITQHNAHHTRLKDFRKNVDTARRNLEDSLILSNTSAAEALKKALATLANIKF